MYFSSLFLNYQPSMGRMGLITLLMIITRLSDKILSRIVLKYQRGTCTFLVDSKNSPDHMINNNKTRVQDVLILDTAVTLCKNVSR